MALHGFISSCRAGLGKLATAVPGRATVNRPLPGRTPTSRPSKVLQRGRLQQLTSCPSRRVLRKAAPESIPELRHPWQHALLPRAPRPKTSGRNVTEATDEQDAFIRTLWAHLLEALQADVFVPAALQQFTTAVQSSPAGVLAVWPFMGSSTSHTNVVCAQFSIADLIHTAFGMQRLQHVLPFIEQLLLTATPLHPNATPTLHDTLSLLAEAYAKPDLQRQHQNCVMRMLHLWDLKPQLLDSNMVVWTSEDPVSYWEPGMPNPDHLLTSGGIFLPCVGQLDQLRPHQWAPSYSALHSNSTIAPTQPSVDAAIAALVKSVPIPTSIKESPAFKAAVDEAVTTGKAEERQPVQPAVTQPETGEALSNASQGTIAAKRVVAQAISSSNLNQQQKTSVLHTLSDSANDRFAILAYQHSRTNTFQFDWNMRMRERRKQKLAQESMQLGLSPVATDIVSRSAADM